MNNNNDSKNDKTGVKRHQNKENNVPESSWKQVFGHILACFIGAWVMAVISLWTTGYGVTYGTLVMISLIASFLTHGDDRRFIMNKLK